MNNIELIWQMAGRMRMKAIEMAYAAGKTGAHLGGGLSCIEILAVLYGKIANNDSNNPYDLNRDRILISKAHCVLAYYTALFEKGFLEEEDLEHFEKNGYDMPGHPLKNLSKGIEYAAGSLGMALSVGVGMALDAKIKKRKNNVYVLLGDGECEEGSVWEAIMYAPHCNLDNLVAIIDRNRLQYDGTTDEIAGLDNIEARFKEFGWCAVTVEDGHDIGKLINAFNIPHEGRPLAIIASTIKGKGVSFMENEGKWHHGVITDEEYKRAMKEVTDNRR